MNITRLNSIFSKIFNSSINSAILKLLLTLLFDPFCFVLFFIDTKSNIESCVQKYSIQFKVLLVIAFKELIDSKF